MKVSTLSVCAFAALASAAAVQKELRAASESRAPVIRDFSTEADPVSQIRFAFNGSDGMTVSWNSPQQLSKPTVYFSPNPDRVFKDQVAVGGPSTTFPTADTWDNHVHISGLKPFTKYFYSVTGQDLSDSEIQNNYFTTAREAGDKSAFAVAIWADLGIIDQNGVLPDTFQSLTNYRDTYEFLWHSGDMGYADDWRSEISAKVFPNETGAVAYTNIMDSFYEELTTVTSNRAYMVGPGNHEAQCDESNIDLCPVGQLNFTAFNNHFSMPTKDQQEGFVQNMWYSWDYGMVHFVQINTETDFPGAPDVDGGIMAGPFGATDQQTKWLEADLKAVDRSKTPWVIVSGHRPWFNANSKCTTCQTAFDSILSDNGVDLVWWGHTHFYGRNTALLNGEIDPAGLNNPSGYISLIVGCGGNFEGHGVGPKPPKEPPAYVETINDTDYGWVRLKINSPEQMTMEFIISSSGEIADTATLTKRH